MHSFYIDPCDPLARQAALKVERLLFAYPARTLFSPRGGVCYVDGDDVGKDYVDEMVILDQPESPQGALWQYTTLIGWLTEHYWACMKNNSQ